MVSGSRAVQAGLLVLSVVAGVVSSLQGRANAGLAVAQSSGFLAAAWSFGSGFLVIAVVALLVPQVRGGLRSLLAEVAAGRLSWWLLVGGSVGALTVLAQSVVAPAAGLAIFTVVSVAGQSIGSLTIDRLGIVGMPRREASWPRLAGAALVVVAVLIVSWPELQTAGVGLLLLLPLVAGLLRGLQQAINGRIRAETGSTFAATFVNFATGAVLLVVVAGIIWAVDGQGPVLVSTPWLLVGGLLGIVVVSIQSFGVRRLGVLLLGLATIAGQLGAALVLDLVLPLPGVHLDWLEVLGTVLAFLSVAVAAIPSRSSRRAVGGRVGLSPPA